MAADPATGRQLWVSDGTPAGTRAVKPVGVLKETFNPSGGPPLPGGAEPGIMAVVGNRVLFSADDGATGRELWVSDGTAGGTRLLREFNPGPRDGLPSPVVEPQTAAVVNGRAVFAATDADHGSEPWSIATSEFLPAPPPPVPTPTPTPAPTPTPGKASVVQGLFPLVFVILFLSSAFFPEQLILEPAKAVAQVNPISLIVEGVRDPVISSLTAATLWQAVAAIAGVAAFSTWLSARALRYRLRTGG